MKHEIPDNPAEIEAKIKLKQTFLRATLAICGSMSSSAAATKIAGVEAGLLKSEIEALQTALTHAAVPAAA